MTTELIEQLRRDAELENAGGDADERRTCGTHQAWCEDCITDSSHANPISKYNWCDEHYQPVQVCRCRPATVEG
jgi:hypothetical protein